MGEWARVEWAGRAPVCGCVHGVSEDARLRVGGPALLERGLNLGMSGVSISLHAENALRRTAAWSSGSAGT